MLDFHGPLMRVSRFIDCVSEWSARVVAWLVLPLMGAMAYEVVIRYTVKPTVWAYDISYMLYGALFMLGAAYTLLKGGHIRADFLYGNWSVRTQAAMDAFCYLVFYFPGIGFFFWVGLDYAWESWERGERSAGSAWMPAIYPLKAVIPVAAALLLMQGLSEFIKSLYAARHGERP